jgi:hypothetical protein
MSFFAPTLRYVPLPPAELADQIFSIDYVALKAGIREFSEK